MAIPTEMVGSLPRPMKLQEAYEAYDQGKIEWAELQAEQDAAAEDSIRRLEEVGEPIVTDGEQRESSFATYPITDTLAGTGLADNLAGDGQFFAIFDDGHHRQLPRLTGGPFRYKTFASEFVEKNRAIATHPVKQAVIAPSMLMLLYPLEGEIEGYSRDQFLADLCDEVEKDIRQAFDAGAVRVSIDFTEGRLANKNDSRNPWTNKDMLQEFIDLNNRVIDRFSAEERVNIGIHTCPGGDCDCVHSKEVPYEKLLSKMFQLNVGYFLIQCASEEDRESVYRMCGEYSREDANGVPRCASWASSTRSTRRSKRPSTSATSWCSRRSTSRSSAWARPTTAASRRSAATSSPSTARRTSRATSRCRRSRLASRASRSRARRLASPRRSGSDTTGDMTDVRDRPSRPSARPVTATSGSGAPSPTSAA